MSPEEIQAMAKGLAEGQAIWYVLSAITGGVFTGAGAYLAEKGKNRATKEDITAITHEVEKVRDEFNRGLEDLKAHHQLRMVAAERRLQAHQEAYVNWKRFFDTACKYELQETQRHVEASMSWYEQNCIFLSPRSRDVFERAQSAAINRVLRLNREEVKSEDFFSNWEQLKAPSTVLLEEVELPGIVVKRAASC